MGLDDFHDCVFAGDFEAVNSYLDRDPSIANARSEEGNTALYIACWGKQPQMVGLLMAHDPDVNARGYLGRTPLHYAVHEGGMLSAAIVRSLLMSGADPAVRDDLGLTVAEWAKVEMTEGLVEVLDLLEPSRKRRPSH